MSFEANVIKYKKEIKAALNGMLVRDLGDGEPVTVNGSEEECREVILRIFDEVVELGLEYMIDNKVLEHMYSELKRLYDNECKRHYNNED